MLLTLLNFIIFFFDNYELSLQQTICNNYLYSIYVSVGYQTVCLSSKVNLGSRCFAVAYIGSDVNLLGRETIKRAIDTLLLLDAGRKNEAIIIVLLILTFHLDFYHPTTNDFKDSIVSVRS